MPYFLLLFSLSTFAAVNLETAYQSALEKTEQKKIADNRYEQSDEQVSQSFGKVLPSLNFVGSYTRQDSSSTGSSISSVSKPDQKLAKFTLTQPLFHGLSDIYGYQAVKKRREAQKAKTFATELQLYKSVAQSYYGLLSALKDKEDLIVQTELTQKRLKEVQDRVKIGRSRKGDLMALESQAAILKAQVAQAENTLYQAQELFKLTTALDAKSELTDPSEAPTASAQTLENYLAAIEKRPDILADKYENEAREEMVAAYRGAHLPSLDFAANYYLYRDGLLADTKWDFGLVLTFPLFTGGITQSQLRENTQKQKEQELTLANTRKTAEKEIRVQYQDYKNLTDQYALLKEAYSASQKNYQEQAKDYKFGLVTNLDVLQALNSLQETKRSLDKTRYAAYTSLALLKASTGEIPKGKAQ